MANLTDTRDGYLDGSRQPAILLPFVLAVFAAHPLCVSFCLSSLLSTRLPPHFSSSLWFAAHPSHAFLHTALRLLTNCFSRCSHPEADLPTRRGQSGEHGRSRCVWLCVQRRLCCVVVLLSFYPQCSNLPGRFSPACLCGNALSSFLSLPVNSGWRFCHPSHPARPHPPCRIPCAFDVVIRVLAIADLLIFCRPAVDVGSVSSSLWLPRIPVFMCCLPSHRVLRIRFCVFSVPCRFVFFFLACPFSGNLFVLA